MNTSTWRRSAGGLCLATLIGTGSGTRGDGTANTGKLATLNYVWHSADQERRISCISCTCGHVSDLVDGPHRAKDRGARIEAVLGRGLRSALRVLCSRR